MKSFTKYITEGLRLGKGSRVIKKPETFNVAKGAIEFGNIIGSVLGLAIFAPQVSHLIVHPVLKAIGMEEKHVEEDD
jgi:hypothetical protein